MTEKNPIGSTFGINNVTKRVMRGQCCGVLHTSRFRVIDRFISDRDATAGFENVAITQW